MSSINNSELVIAGQESISKDTWIVSGHKGPGKQARMTGQEFRVFEAALADAGRSLIKTVYCLHAGTPSIATMMYRGGRLDCDNGPAVSIEGINGGSITEQWYVAGQRISEEEFNSTILSNRKT